MALEMILTSVDVLGIDITKGLPSYRKTRMSSKVSTSQGMVDRVWVRTCGDVG